MSTYTGSSIATLNVLTPTVGTAQVKEIDDALRQIKRFLRESGTGTLVDLMYPVGFEYRSFTSNDPSVDIQNRHSLPAPFGTWVKLSGVFTVAHKEGDADFGTVTPPVADNEAPDGGTKEETLTVDQVPHIESFTTVTGGFYNNVTDEPIPYDDTSSTIGKTENNNGTGSDTGISFKGTPAANPVNNLPPYRTIYAWVRTA